MRSRDEVLVQQVILQPRVVTERFPDAFDWFFFFFLIYSNFAPAGSVKETYAQEARINAGTTTSSLPLNFSFNFCVSLKQPFLPDKTLTVQTPFFSSCSRSQTPPRTGSSVHTGLLGFTQRCSWRSVHRNGARQILPSSRWGERGGWWGGGITVVANSLKSINAYWKRNPDGEQLLRWFGLDRFFIYLFFCSAQPSYGRERRREISNLPQMEPLCPVTDELFRRVLKTKADW